MTDSALSQQLNQWKTRLNTITNNLFDLYGAESTTLIRARVNDQVNGFSGATKTKAARAIEPLGPSGRVMDGGHPLALSVPAA